MINLKNEAEMIAFGKRIGETIFPHSIITLTGDLGAGKTTFTKGIGQGLEIKKGQMMIWGLKRCLKMMAYV